MAKRPLYRDQIHKYLTQSEVPPWIDNDYLWVSLHHSTPFWSDDQTEYEVSYTGYARQPIARTASAWVYSGGYARNAAEITFPNPSGTTTDEVWWVGLGTHETGAGQLLYVSNIFQEIYLISVNQPLVIPAQGLAVRET